jgi:hypothetical protein
MKTEASVDLLRSMLVGRGHILPSRQTDSKCIILNQGEYLVSLLSHDQHLLEFISYSDESLLWAESFGEDFLRDVARTMVGHYDFGIDSYVDTIKFSWIVVGVTKTLDFIKEKGYRWWSGLSLRQRDDCLDDMVLMAQRQLRHAGCTYRQMAEFFSEGKAVMKLRGKTSISKLLS